MQMYFTKCIVWFQTTMMVIKQFLTISPFKSNDWKHNIAEWRRSEWLRENLDEPYMFVTVSRHLY